LMVLVPDVRVGVFPQPAEVARLMKGDGVSKVAGDRESIAGLC
jgi:hypothetical protein